MVRFSISIEEFAHHDEHGYGRHVDRPRKPPGRHPIDRTRSYFSHPNLEGFVLIMTRNSMFSTHADRRYVFPVLRNLIHFIREYIITL